MIDIIQMMNDSAPWLKYETVFEEHAVDIKLGYIVEIDGDKVGCSVNVPIVGINDFIVQQKIDTLVSDISNFINTHIVK